MAFFLNDPLCQNDRQPETLTQYVVHANIYNAFHTTTDTLSLSHIFLLRGTDWLQVLSNHVGNAENLFNAHMLLWLRPSSKKQLDVLLCAGMLVKQLFSTFLMLPFVQLSE